MPAEGHSGEVQGQVIFVGQGISSASQKHDDYSGLDVKGKIVLIAPARLPMWMSRSLERMSQGKAQPSLTERLAFFSCRRSACWT